MDNKLDIIVSKDDKNSWGQKANERDKIINDSNGKLTYQFVGDTIRFFRLESIEEPTYLKYPILKDSLWSNYVLTDEKIEWLKPIESSVYVTRATQFKFVDNELHSTLELDSKLFEVEIVNKPPTISIPPDTTKVHTPQELQPGYKEMEIIALRNFIMKKYEEHHNVGPIIKARRNFDRFIEKNTKFSSIDSLRYKINGWINEHIINSIKP